MSEKTPLNPESEWCERCSSLFCCRKQTIAEVLKILPLCRDKTDIWADERWVNFEKMFKKEIKNLKDKSPETLAVSKDTRKGCGKRFKGSDGFHRICGGIYPDNWVALCEDCKGTK